MSDTIIVALLSLGGTLAGTFGGILTSSRLTNYRIQKLEEKVQKHNNLIERMYNVEGDIESIRNEIKLRHGG
jgi:hypothetical protein